jgi:hypothetical protein
MADIRLKKITVEAQQSPLIIQNGDVTINSTTTSDSILSGSFITKGGISIVGSVDSNSSTSGGALTVAGGLGIMKNAYIGKDLVLDSTNSILQINGLSTNRLFLDTITNKNFYISPDGVNKRFELSDTSLQINITNPSTNSSSGALYVSGGISIGSSINASSGSNGGALTVAGGASIGMNLNVVGTIENLNGIIINSCDNQLTLNNSLNVSSSTINVTGDNLNIHNFTGDIDIFSSTGNINLNQMFTISQTESIFYNSISVTNTTPFTNTSTASLVVHGGVSIANTIDAVSISDGSLNIAGGVSIHKHTFMGDSLSIDQSNSKKNKIILSGELEESDQFTGFGNTEGSIVYQIPNTSSCHIFYAGTSVNTSNEIFKITGEGDVRLSGKTQAYTIVGGGKSDTDLSFQSSNVSEKSSVNFFTQNGTATEDNDICIFGLGLPSQTSDSEYLRLGWDSTNNYYEIAAKHSGTGVLRDLVLGGQGVVIQTSGTILFNNQTVVDNIFDIVSTENSTGVSTGSLRVAGGATIARDLFLNNDLVLGSETDECQMKINTTVIDNFSTLTFTGSQNKYPSIHVIGDTSVSSMVYPFDFSMYSLGNPNSLNNESLKISTTTNGYYIKTTHSGVGFARFIDIHSVDNYNQLVLQTYGNVGIGISEPIAKLDIGGTLHCNDIVTFTSSIDSINSSTASLVLTGGVSIMTSTEAESVTNGGALSIAGGASIAKSVFIGGVTHFLDETPSTSYLQASVVVHGGLSIQNGENAIGVGNGGGLSVAGGASVGGDLYVGGSINGSGSSSSTYAYLTLTSVDDAINYSSGSLVTYGGITIQTDTNAVGLGTGGSLLAAGGASIAKDVYIGGDTYFSGVTNYKSITDNIINMYDNFNIRRFSINKSTVSHAFSISRYDSLGNHVERTFDISNSDGVVLFNNTTLSTSANNASVVFLGGIGISNTNPAVTLENGGALTVAGGVSIAKNVKVGGDLLIYSSTPSNNVSTGAVLISGGVGISGDVNVLGNTQIIGNLTVNGQTTSINATNTVIKDNVLVLNSGPTGSRDSGFIVQRYQQDNDTGAGDVVADSYPEIITLPNQSGMNSNQIKFSMSSSAIDEHYTGWWLKIASGFSNNQIRKITSYNGTTKIATVSSDWTTQNPSGGDNVYLYNKPFIGIVYNEINDRFEFGSSVQNPEQSNITFSDYLPIYAGSATYISTAVSSNSSSGSVLLAGGISISNTTDSSSVTGGGTITTAGGGSIAKTLYVGQGLYVNNTRMTPNSQDRFTSVIFTGQNNQSTFTDITDLYFDNTIWGFDIYLCAKIVASSNLYTNFHIRGVNKNGSWEIIKTYVGDDTGIQFHITDFGQLQYITPDFSGFTSCQFKYRAFVN